MLAAFGEGSALTVAVLAVCFVLVLIFEFSNGFHDTANAVATVIYTNSLSPTQAVVWSGILNFIGVVAGGIAVAYALVELIPPEVLSPPDGTLATGMLASVFISALIWNVGTWWLGLPNSSSHALIGSLIGITAVAALGHGQRLTLAINFKQVWSVLSALLVSPLLGFVLALVSFKCAAFVLRDKALFEPPAEGRPPPWWIRALLILTCTGVSFSHGTNDGQKGIGLIMLTVIGLMPSTYALNPTMTPEQIRAIAGAMPEAVGLVQRGGERRDQDISHANALRDRLSALNSLDDVPQAQRASVRDDVNHVLAALRAVSQSKSSSDADKGEAKALHDQIRLAVEYAPWWVRVLSALCLGLGTMVGYRRIVKTLGERLGQKHLVPLQGASAELVAAGLIGSAGFTGYPVSTTHVVTGGIAGTMVASGAGLQRNVPRQIALAWILTLPGTVLLSGLLFWILS